MDEKLLKRVIKESGVNINLCYQCKTCSLSCPFAAMMDILPHRIIRKIQTGEDDRVLGSNAIWRCASCETCVTRCPNGIDIPRLMDYLRQQATRKKAVYGGNIGIFHRAFINGAVRWGRQYELGMLLDFKLKSKDYFSDLRLGMNMLRKHKLPLFPVSGKTGKEIKKQLKTLKKTHG
jgi:heterodisulfide reductase subunit C2